MLSFCRFHSLWFLSPQIYIMRHRLKIKLPKTRSKIRQTPSDLDLESVCSSSSFEWVFVILNRFHHSMAGKSSNLFSCRHHHLLFPSLLLPLVRFSYFYRRKSTKALRSHLLLSCCNLKQASISQSAPVRAQTQKVYMKLLWSTISIEV